MKVVLLVLRHGVGEKPLRRIEGDGGQVPSLPHRYLARSGRMSHQASLVVGPERVGRVLDGSHEGRRSDNKPTGTYIGDEQEFWIFRGLMLTCHQISL